MPAAPSSPKRVAIIGAGPAGLTAAWQLSRAGVPVTVFEADPHLVGGIARTVEYKGFRFDIGGHRFFSKSQEVEELWTELLKDDMLLRPRSSRIYNRGSSTPTRSRRESRCGTWACWNRVGVSVRMRGPGCFP